MQVYVSIYIYIYIYIYILIAQNHFYHKTMVTGKFFTLYCCHFPVWGVNVSPLASKSLETRRQAISPFACNFLDGVTILPFFREHCTLTTTLEIGKIYSNYLHFLSYLLKCPVDNTKFQAPKFKNFLGEHAPQTVIPPTLDRLRTSNFFSFAYTLKNLTLCPLNL